MLFSWCQWIQNTKVSIAVREGALLYPIIEGLHILAIAIFGGMLLAADVRLEAGSPNVSLRGGFTKATVASGTQELVEGYQAKDGSNRANGRDLTLPDGKKLFLGSSGTGAPYESNKEK